MVKILFSTVMIMLVYMCIGFIMCKAKKVKVSHAKSMSAILLYILGPAMIINSFIQLEYSGDNLIKIAKYFAVSLTIQLIAFGIIYIILHKKYEDSKYRILSVGAVLGNVGYLGMPIIASIFPNESIVLCYSSINVMSMNLIVFTIGTFLITNDKQFISVKSAIFNPTTISILISLPLFIFNVSFLDIIMESISLLAKMVTPFCMFVLGMRLAEAEFKKIFTRPFVYVTCLLKLVIFPVLAFVLVTWLPFIDNITKTSVVVLAMVPSGAIIESLAELHECEQEFAANVVLVTTILSVLTIPVMYILLG